MIHYAVAVDGRVVGSRSSKSHAQQIYTHAVVEAANLASYVVISYHSTERLAQQARDSWQSQRSQFGSSYTRGPLSVVPVAVTQKRAKVGDLIVPQGVL